MLNSMLNSSEKSGPLLAATERIFTLKKKKIWPVFSDSEYFWKAYFLTVPLYLV